MTVDRSEVEESFRPPTVFISYSWDSEEHKHWVLDLATTLVQKRVQVIVDQWNLHPGEDAIRFMEESVAKSDHVLVICTPQYAVKANGRKGAAGYETTILTSSLVEDLDTRKFIPILREGAWGISGSIPRWLAARSGIDLRGNPYAETQFEQLLCALDGQLVGPPPLGDAPLSQSPAASPTRKPPHRAAVGQPSIRGAWSTPDSDALLDAKETELLWHAAQDSSGQIAHIKAIGGERLSVNGQTYPEQRDARSSAEWFGALRSLVRHGLVEGVGLDPDYYRVTTQGWQKSDTLGDFAFWKVPEFTLERRYFGDTPPDVLTLPCRKIVRLPVALYPDRISVKEPKTFIVEGVDLSDTRLKQGLPFEPTHVGFRDPTTQEEAWFCVYPGSQVTGRHLRIPING